MGDPAGSRANSSHRQSTARAQNTEDPSVRSGEVAVRWLFPATSGPVTSLSSKDRVLLGRGDDCHFVLAGTEASRHHAEIRRTGPVFVVRDLGSTNGSFVDGARVTEAPLPPGSVLRVGEWIGIVIEVTAAPVPDEGFFRRIATGFYGGPKLAAVLDPLRRAAGTDLPVVVEGETGSGKERVARALHEWSGRKGAFVAVNCAALPEALAEGELFGYRKGAFTGADRASVGHFRAAQGGTLLLDEITDLPVPLQAKLLRALDQREVQPLGEPAPVSVDVRTIAATQDPLADAVAAKRFRGDLYARLEGVTVRLPPLRERREDVPGLFARFLQQHSGGHMPAVEPKLIEQLCLYDWPFNVRELEFLARRLLGLHGHEPSLKRAHLPERIRAAGKGAGGQESSDGARNTPDAAGPQATSAEPDVVALVAALRVHGGNVARAAAALGISRQRAYRLMEGHPDVDLEALRGAREGGGRSP